MFVKNRNRSNIPCNVSMKLSYVPAFFRKIVFSSVSHRTQKCFKMHSLSAVVILFGWFQILAQTISSPTTGVSASVVSQSGTYSVTSATPAWEFSGTLGTALSNVTTASAADSLGGYQEIQFTYTQGGAKSGTIRVYQSVPVVLFSKTFVASAASQGTKFPVFTTYPQRLYVQGYAGRWGTYQYDLTKIENTSPAVFFDQNRNTFVISPASCFMDAQMTYSASSISSGLQSYAANFPAGYTYTTVLTIQAGINAAFDTWGGALTVLNGKTRPKNDADVLLEKCGYWTDNKATYYYKYDQSLGSYEKTLLAVKQAFTSANIDLGYLQLDSWWYPKGPEQSWAKGTGGSDFSNGCWVYRAHPELFPNGLANFKQRLGIPLITHGRWFSNTSPYLSVYKNSYTSSYGAIIDSVFWDTIATYLQQSGVAVYEQDWLDNFAKPAYTLNLGEQFMTNMAQGMQKHDITIQYCMVVPRHYLQASQYSNVTTMRISQDGFDLSKRDQIFYLSRVARSVGTYPWTDGFASSDLSRMTVAVLTAGVVGFIDAIGAQNTSNILQAVRRDGVIVKPDVPITPTDETYVSHASNGGNAATTPMVGITYTDFGTTRIQYVFAYKRSGTGSFTFNPDRYGLSGSSVYAYNYRTATGSVLPSGTALSGTVSDWSYYLLSPVGPSGIAFLGDKGKIASCGTKRISSLTQNANQVSVTVAIEPKSTSVTLFGYAAKGPTAIAGAGGSVGPLSYNASNHLWNVTVTPASVNRTSVVQIPVYIGYDPVGIIAKTPSATLEALNIRVTGGILKVDMGTVCDFSVNIFDLKGRLVQSAMAAHALSWEQPLKRLNHGTYIIRIVNGLGSMEKKIIWK